MNFDPAMKTLIRTPVFCIFIDTNGEEPAITHLKCGLSSQPEACVCAAYRRHLRLLGIFTEPLRKYNYDAYP